MSEYKEESRIVELIPVSDKRNGKAMVLLRCSCGNEKLVRKDHAGKRTFSCGCLHDYIRRIATLKHGHNRSVTIGKSPTYATWQNMKKRCLNPNTIQWKDYGGAGIKVCKRWYKFENFLLDMGERPTRNHSIDRINPFRDYSPKNCRWATRKKQANNTKGHYAIQILKRFKRTPASII